MEESYELRILRAPRSKRGQPRFLVVDNVIKHTAGKSTPRYLPSGSLFVVLDRVFWKEFLVIPNAEVVMRANDQPSQPSIKASMPVVGEFSWRADMHVPALMAGYKFELQHRSHGEIYNYVSIGLQAARREGGQRQSIVIS